jgi:hypothetical protein
MPLPSRFLVAGGASDLLDSLNWKADARVFTATNINLAAPGANLDGVAMVVGQRFVAGGQTAPAENGIYVYNGAAAPATRAPDADVSAELNNATISIEAGTSAGTTWRQTAINPTIGVTAITWTTFGSGNVVGPASSTDNALAVFSGITGKLIKDSLVVLSVVGALLAPAGTAALPAFSPLANAGLHATGVAHTIALSTNSTDRLTIDTAAITSTLPYVAPLGAVGTPSSTFVGDLNTGSYSPGADQYNIATGGVLGLALAVQTSGTGANLAITDSTRTGGAGVSQVGVTISHTLNQTGTAAFTSLQVSQVVTAAGSGAQLLFNGLAGAAGTTQVAAITSAGAVLSTGTITVPGHSFAAETGLGWYRQAAGVMRMAQGGVDIFTLNATGPSLGFNQTNTRIESLVANGQFSISGAYAANAGGPFFITNGAAFTASTGVNQRSVLIVSPVNQTSTASFTSLIINQALTTGQTGAPVFGSGGGLFVDFQTTGTSVAAITSAGTVLAQGGTVVNAFAFIDQPTTGIYKSATGTIATSHNGTLGVRFGPGPQIGNLTNTLGLTLFGQISQSATPSLSLINNNSFTGGATAQIHTSIAATVNQTATAAFTLLDLATTETGLGSGVQLLINCKAGAAGTTQVFAVTNKGGFGTAVVSPAALANGNVDDYAGFAHYSFARATPDATATSLRGILAPTTSLARRLTIINLGNGAGTLTVQNQDAGSAAANRIQTKTGAATVIATNGVMNLIYDPTSAFWREV